MSKQQLDVYTIDEIIKTIEKRIAGFKIDIRMGHLQRVLDGLLQQGYADENQALILVDHLMRMRTYSEVIADLKLKRNEVTNSNS